MLDILSMVDLTSISVMLAAIGVFVGVVIAVLELRNLKRQREIEIETRQAQLFMQICDYFYRQDFLSDENEILFKWKWKARARARRMLKPLINGIQLEHTLKVLECL